MKVIITLGFHNSKKKGKNKDIVLMQQGNTHGEAQSVVRIVGHSGLGTLNIPESVVQQWCESTNNHASVHHHEMCFLLICSQGG